MPPTVLRLDLSKESITPKETKKQPTIGAPGMAPGIGGVSVDPMAGMAGNYDAAAELVLVMKCLSNILIQ